MSDCDPSGLIVAIDDYALAALDCIGLDMEDTGQSEAPQDTGAMSDSVRWGGASGGGGSVSGDLVVGEDYAWFTTQDELEGHPYMVWEGPDGLIFAKVVHPSRPDWWQTTLDSFPAAVGGCGG